MAAVVALLVSHYFDCAFSQKNVTQADFERIAMDQLTELWTRYGNFSEIWLDGGYPLTMLPKMKSLIRTAQPRAVAFNGLGNC
eukprot:COSAG02_NODE_240_length_27672_cov_67.291445_13_plen_83_part_00